MFSKLVILLVLLTSAPVLAQETIRISYNSDWPPYSFGSGEEVRGVLPDLMQIIFEDHLGMKVEQAGFPWKRAQIEVESGDFDAMVTFPSEKRLEYAYRSDSIVYQLRQRPVVRRHSETEQALSTNPTVEELAKQRICAMIGDGWSESFYKKNNIHFNTAKDTQACLRLVATGRMDVFLHMEAATRHNMRLSDTTEALKHLPTVMGEMPFTLLISKRKTNAPEIMARFDKVVAQLQQDGTYDALISELNRKDYTVK